MAIRAAVVAAATVPLPAAAETWLLNTGFTARGEFTDNYFLTAGSKQRAFTASIGPFVTLARSTETSDVAALVSVSGNTVLGLPESENYLAGRVALNGSLRSDRSKWAGDISFSRNPRLQNQVTPVGTILSLVMTNVATVNGSYEYWLSDRWQITASMGGVEYWYENIQDSAGNRSQETLQDNRGYVGGGRLGYIYSVQTQVELSTYYGKYISDTTSSDAVTTTIGLVHQFSPQLTVSASVGGFWGNIEVSRTGFVCPTTPILCDTGVVPRLPVISGEQRSGNGHLYGGNVTYAITENTRLIANLLESLAPSSAGTLSKTDNVSATLAHRFSDRLSARLAAAYTRTVFPSGAAGLSTTNLYSGEMGISYSLAERWKLEAGYRYNRAEYAETGAEPQANVVFISIGYGWPAESFTNWIGVRQDSQVLPGAGPVPLDERSPLTTRSTSATGIPRSTGTQSSGQPASSPVSPLFDQFTIP